MDDINTRISCAESIVNDQSNRLNVIEGTVTTLSENYKSLDVNAISHKYFSEFQSRLSRSKNLILFSFNEDSEANFDNFSIAIKSLFSKFSLPSLQED